MLTVSESASPVVTLDFSISFHFQSENVTSIFGILAPIESALFGIETCEMPNMTFERNMARACLAKREKRGRKWVGDSMVRSIFW